MNNEELNAQPVWYIDSAELKEMLFPEAAEAWLSTRRRHIAPRTYKDYRWYIRTLSQHFGKAKLAEITGDQVRRYQQMRSTTAGPGSINKECGIIVQMRQRIGLPLTDYQPLRMPKDWESPGRALSPAEEEKLEQVFKAAADHRLLKTAALVSLLSMKCGAGPGEIRSLRLKDVCLEPAQIVIPRSGAKREKRERLVMLNSTAAWALERLLNRARQECGCCLPEHYLIPYRCRNHSYDPSRPPAAGWREGLSKLLAIAGVQIRPYDFRHHAVSRSLQDPRVPLEAAKAYYGWISPKMIARYYHADVAALKAVAAAIDGGRAEAHTQVLRNQDVLAMLDGGLPADVVVESIRSSFCSFDVSPQTLMQMKESGVPAVVIKEMVRGNRKPCLPSIAPIDHQRRRGSRG